MAPCKLYPVGIFRLQCSFSQCGAASAHSLGEPSMTFAQTWGEEELIGTADTCGRMPVGHIGLYDRAGNRQITPALTNENHALRAAYLRVASFRVPRWPEADRGGRL